MDRYVFAYLYGVAPVHISGFFMGPHCLQCYWGTFERVQFLTQLAIWFGFRIRYRFILNDEYLYKGYVYPLLLIFCVYGFYSVPFREAWTESLDSSLAVALLQLSWGYVYGILHALASVFIGTLQPCSILFLFLLFLATVSDRLRRQHV